MAHPLPIQEAVDNGVGSFIVNAYANHMALRC